MLCYYFFVLPYRIVWIKKRKETCKYGHSGARPGYLRLALAEIILSIIGAIELASVTEMCTVTEKTLCLVINLYNYVNVLIYVTM